MEIPKNYFLINHFYKSFRDETIFKQIWEKCPTIPSEDVDEGKIDNEIDKIFDLMIWFNLLCLTPLSAIFQLYHGDQF